MPRSRLKINRPDPNKKDFEDAIQNVVNGKMSLREAAAVFKISKSAIQRRKKEHEASGKNAFEYAPKYAVKLVFSSEEERSLVAYIKEAAKLKFGLTTNSVCKLAFEYAKSNEIKYPTEWDVSQKAGEHWLRGFKSRNRDLSLRKPEATSLSRATAFNRTNFAIFFRNYSDVLSRCHFDPSRIWNIDETGLSTVHVPPKVFSARGTKQVGGVTSGERGQNITMIAAINAIGNAVPPMFVFPRVNFKNHMLAGAPPGSVGEANPSGWSNERIFVKYFEHFLTYTNPSKDNSIVVVYDNVDAHISINVIKKAKECGVILVTFHPHTSHKMQPLDRTVFGPFKTFYNKAANDWMGSPGNYGKPVTIYEVASIAGKAYTLSFTPSNIVNGFRVTGLCPLNKDIFTDEDFLSSYVTDRPLDQPSSDVSGPSADMVQMIQPSSDVPGPSAGLVQLDQPSSDVSGPSAGSVQLDQPSSDVPGPSAGSLLMIQPSYDVSGSSTSNIITSPQLGSSTSSAIVSPEMVRPFPKAGPRKNDPCKRSRKGKSRVLTDTPEKDAIEAAQEGRNRFDIKKKKKNIKRVKKIKKTLFDETDNEEIDESLLNSASDNNDLDSYLQQIMNEERESEMERNLESEEVNIGDYVLVQVKGKKSIKFFVAVITSKVAADAVNVRYLKKITGHFKPKFVDNSNDEFEVENEDIISKLPPPSKVGGSVRNDNKLQFSISFSGIELGS